MPKDDGIIFDGIVESEQGNGFFKVRINDQESNVENFVLAKVCGKMRQHRIRVIPGDKVTVCVSMYDTSRGIINRRFKT